MSFPALGMLATRLAERLPVKCDRPVGYRIPGLWLNPYGDSAELEVVPERFYLERIAAIWSSPPQELVASRGRGPHGAGEWGRYAVAYNLFVRAGAAWDHNGDGTISPEPDASGWRETGTFLKAIALLPHIRALGCNTVHLLPISDIGRDGAKGNLGSPFAIRDPYSLDAAQAEPALGLGPETEFAAFVEAAHHLGLRVIVEFVLRTAAKDAAWAGEHPEWFYWIREDVADRKPDSRDETAYGAPLWTAAELEQIYRQVGAGDWSNLPAPHAAYRRMFAPPPKPADVRLVSGRWQGTVFDRRSGTQVTVRIPGAFADWTPDSDQPPWSDVTYLRLYDHPDFNYIAYNTVRMYDVRLTAPGRAVAALWERLVDVIPHYRRAFGIDGVMIDMGHALPMTLKQHMVARAREQAPDFAFWAEDFDLKPSSRAEGYNVCVGPFMQTVRDRQRLVPWLQEIAERGVPVPFMAMAENHNCPRAVTWPGGRTYALYAQAVGAFLPGVPYLHGGIELAETQPLNTGFDFTAEQQARLPAAGLLLFSAGAYRWTGVPNLIAELRRLHEVRAAYADLITEPKPGTVSLLETGHPRVVGFTRGEPGSPRLAVIANSDMAAPATCRPALELAGIRDVISGAEYRAGADGRLELALEPGQVIVAET